MSILHKKMMQVVLVKELDIQDIVTLKKCDKKIKKFLTKKKRCDKVNKLSTNSKSVEKKI